MLPPNVFLCVQLAAGIQQVLAREGAVKPDKCRYFRGQMSTIISRALADLGIEPLPSRRCFALLGKPPIISPIYNTNSAQSAIFMRILVQDGEAELDEQYLISMSLQAMNLQTAPIQAWP